MISKSIYHQDPDRNKVKAFYIREDELMFLLLCDQNLRIETNLPSDSIIRNINFDSNVLGFRIVIQSQEFSERREGEMIENISNPIKITPLEVWKKDQIRQIKE